MFTPGRSLRSLSTLSFLVLVAASAGAMGCTARAQVRVATAEPAPPPPPPAAPAPEPAKVGKIELPGELEFETGRATIRETDASKQILAALLDVMKRHPEITKLRIEGHTDNRGRAATNQRLSEDRAEAVAQWLATREVERTRLVTVGFGDTRPIAQNDTAEHRQANRRTEFHVEELNGKPPAPEQVASR